VKQCSPARSVGGSMERRNQCCTASSWHPCHRCSPLQASATSSASPGCGSTESVRRRSILGSITWSGCHRLRNDIRVALTSSGLHTVEIRCVPPSARAIRGSRGFDIRPSVSPSRRRMLMAPNRSRAPGHVGPWWLVELSMSALRTPQVRHPGPTRKPTEHRTPHSSWRMRRRQREGAHRAQATQPGVAGTPHQCSRGALREADGQGPRLGTRPMMRRRAGPSWRVVPRRNDSQQFLDCHTK